MELEVYKTQYYTICNTTSGKGLNQSKIDQILALFKAYKISYKFIKTSYAHHEEILVQKAIEKGYNKFICIGGDGTLHHMINGIMKQKFIATNDITIAVIPTGTGNDWVKNYRIPRNTKKAIQLIKQPKTIYQDIGELSLLDDDRVVYFNNAAGLGYDSFVVKNIPKYKRFGSLSYLIAGLSSYRLFKTNHLRYQLDSKKKRSEIFMISLGICKYSGGGMQLTDFKNHKDNYFDVSIIKNISLGQILINIHKMYNGFINDIDEVNCFNIQNFKTLDNQSFYIQADGELIGTGNVKINLHPKAIQFIIS